MAEHQWVIIGNPESRPVALVQEALKRRGLPPARIVAYADLLAEQVALPDVVRAGDVVRIETPGRNFKVELDMLWLGATQPEPEPAHYGCASQSWLNHVFEDPADDGVPVLYPRQWYLGYCALLRRIEQQLAACPPHRLLNSPADIMLMFDKRQCHALLEQHGIPVPRSLGPVTCYDELAAAMQHTGCNQVFVKLAHGSSAAGTVAYRTNGREHIAITTVDDIRYDADGCPRFFNTRRLRTLRGLREIAALIDVICLHRAHVEQWLPKAGIDGYSFDLRVVMIGGQVRHVVPRLSRTPMTNLHLLNRRGDIERVRARMSDAAWQMLCCTCTQVAALFPDSLYMGLDVLVLPGYQRHVILECNAFGDLLPGLLWEGMDTYEAEIAAVMG
jgi:hypothetical protein